MKLKPKPKPKPKSKRSRWNNVHIDWSKSTVSDGTAHGTSKSETKVEIKSLRLPLGSSLDLGRSNRRESHNKGDEWEGIDLSQ